MKDLFSGPTPKTKPGEANGAALAYIVMGETREQLRERVRGGELESANMGYIDQWLKEVGR